MKDSLAHPAPGRSYPTLAGGSPAPAAPPASAPGAPLVEVLWRRRWTVVLTMLLCVSAAGAYLCFAPRVYRSTARVVVGESGPGAAGGRAEPAGESFVETQRNAFQSYAVLSRALDSINARNMQTFARAPGDPAGFLQAGNGYDVDVANKSDVIVVSMESQWPQEAADVANAVARAYTALQLERKRAAGEETVRALRKEREDLQSKWDVALRSMVRQQRASGVLSFKTNDGGNLISERAAALSAALTSAQIAAVELRAQRDSMATALADPASASAFVESLQVKERDGGDHEYDELRNQLVQQTMALRTSASLLMAGHPGIVALEARVNSLKQRLAEKEREIIRARIVDVTTQLNAAEQREKQLRAALEAQQAQALDMSPAAVQYATLEAEVLRLQRECESLDNRIADVTATDIESRQLNVDVQEWARPGRTPVKPRVGLTLLAGLVAGWVLGVGMAVLRESRDSRLRTPEEALALLGTPVLAVIPRMDGHLSPVARGQMTHLDPRSQAAEAYRSIRLSLGVGAARTARTILVTSPSPGEGKSTTAGNLAIALAQGGHRTLLIDCDLHQPVQHYIFEAEEAGDAPAGATGLTGVLAGRVKLRGAVVPTRVAGLYLLPCGPLPADPAELLAGKRFEQALETLAETFDRVVIDSPALAATSESRSLAMLADATVLVLRMNQSSREMSLRALAALEAIGVEVAGVVANDVPVARREPAYSGFEGAWQYAAAGGRLAAPGAGLEDGARATARPLPRPAEEVLAIDEPDWSVAEAP